MKMLKEFNDKMGTNYKTVEELTADLNNLFRDKADLYEDFQELFDDLNDDIGGDLLADNYCYMLSEPGEWSISIDRDSFSDEMIQLFVASGWNVKSVDELESAIENKVMDTESNVGCDAYNALMLEMEDFPEGFDWEDFIKVNVPDGEPSLILIDELFDKTDDYEL